MLNEDLSCEIHLVILKRNTNHIPSLILRHLQEHKSLLLEVGLLQYWEEMKNSIEKYKISVYKLKTEYENFLSMNRISEHIHQISQI